MKNLRTSWKVIALVAVGAILSVCYVIKSRGFTLIEIQYLPAVQLVANQSAWVNVSNVAMDSVDATIAIYSGNGALLATKTVTVASGQTSTLKYTHPSGMAPNNIRAVVSLGTANAVVSDITAADVTSGQVIAILPFIKFTGNGQ